MAAHSDHHADEKHPNYLAVFIILAVITGVMTIVEVFFAESMDRAVLNTVYLGLSLIKAVLVAMYYMHLKMHSRFYTALFMAPIILVTTLVIILLI